MHELPDEVRLVLLRSGVVVSPEGGIIPKIINPIRFNMGVWFGTGKQLISWIHIQDLANAIIHLLTHPHAKGPFNLVAPKPLKQRKLVKKIAKQMKRLAWISIPTFLIRWFYGAMGREILLSGQNVDSSKLQDSGFLFTFPTIESAIEDIVSSA